MIGMVFGSMGTPFWPWHAAHACALASMSSAASAGTAVTANPTTAPKITEMRRVNMAAFLPSRGCARCRMTASIQTKPAGRNATRPPGRSFIGPTNSAPKPADRACSVTSAESRWRNRRLSTESVTSPKASSLRATNRFPLGRKAMQSKLMLSLTASAAVMLFQPTTQTVFAQGQAALTGTVSSEAEGNMEGVVVTAKKPGSIVEVSVTTDAQGRYTFPENRLGPGNYAISIRAVGYDISAPA